MASIRDYAAIVGEDTIDELFALAERLERRSMLHVNSTAVGGGVAEILSRFMPLLKELGLDVRWDVIRGGRDFFTITKNFHNALQGNPFDFSPEMLETYIRYNRMNARVDFDKDVIIIHDPQPAALIEEREDDRPWVWRCHIDISSPDIKLWEFLKQYVSQYDAAIFSKPAFARPDLDVKQYMIAPSIDPLSEKNRDMSEDEVREVLERFGISTDVPIVCQVGRFDRFKDPIGVIKAYKRARERVTCQLVLWGSMATDDPEGMEVYREVQKVAEGEEGITLLTEISDIGINAIQRASAVVLQKSLKEGFALTVSEALWKGTPVIGGAVGGIPLQVKNGINGYLVHSVEGCANAIVKLLRNPDLARRLGENGREHVRRNFLLTRHMREYLLLMHALEHPGENFIQL
ncbi:MAG: glycosyltransferase [Euryarchaeota archaeon]|nr:glycosyltransferase [Euryarchaeota archaeon]